jgi:hypothetical protein
MHPENALLDFQRDTAPLVCLADLIDSDMDASERERALALAVQQIHERAERTPEVVAQRSD